MGFELAKKHIIAEEIEAALDPRWGWVDDDVDRKDHERRIALLERAETATDFCILYNLLYDEYIKDLFGWYYTMYEYKMDEEMTRAEELLAAWEFEHDR